MTTADMQTVSARTVNAVLHYGYDPGCTRAGLPDRIVRAARSPPATDADRDALIARGAAALRAAVETALEAVDESTTHVVPLSAGLDSRAILAALLEHRDVEQRQIHTVTFGSPGTWDFEIGQRVAATAGVQNTAIDLTGDAIDWSVAPIRAYAASRECPGGILDGYVNSVASAVGGDGAIVWSGFMGDPTAGGHQPSDPARSWEAACDAFAGAERRARGLTSPDFDPRSVLPSRPALQREHLSYEEQLDFAHRQQCLVAPTVIHSPETRTPFMQLPWLEYSLSLPRRHRRNRSIVREVLVETYPDLFSLPTDASAGSHPTAGLSRRAVRLGALRIAEWAASLVGVSYTRPDTNYLDFERAFRSEPLRGLIDTVVASFEDRSVADWVDARGVWADHLAGADRSGELVVVLGLELHLATRDS